MGCIFHGVAKSQDRTEQLSLPLLLWVDHLLWCRVHPFPLGGEVCLKSGNRSFSGRNLLPKNPSCRFSLLKWFKGNFLHPRWSSGHANISSVHITKSLDLGSSNRDKKFLRWSYTWELLRLEFKKPIVTMPKAVTASVGQHNMLNATSMTFSICSYPVIHHLAHLPKPSPNRDSLVFTLCIATLLGPEVARQGFES